MKDRLDTYKQQFNEQLEQKMQARDQIFSTGSKATQRKEIRKIGAFLFGLSLFLAFSIAIAVFFFQLLPGRLTVFTGVLFIVSILIMITGWLPKKARPKPRG